METLEYIQYCTSNNKDVMESNKAVCVYCKNEFLKEETPNLEPYQQIYKKWEFFVLEDEGTVLCPKCGIDAIIGNKTITWTRADVERWHTMGFESA